MNGNEKRWAGKYIIVDQEKISGDEVDVQDGQIGYGAYILGSNHNNIVSSSIPKSETLREQEYLSEGKDHVDSIEECIKNNRTQKDSSTIPMGSILKSLTISRIPMDNESLIIRVKWELNYRRRTELFLLQGEVGEVTGEVMLTRKELKDFSPVGREAYLVFWLEGIQNFSIIVDRSHPTLKDLEVFIIKEASLIVDRKLLNIKQFTESILSITDEELECNLYYHLRQLYLIQKSDYRNLLLEQSWDSFMLNLKKKEVAERSEWITKYGDDYIKFLNASHQIENNVELYVRQRLEMELPGFHMLEEKFNYIYNSSYLEQFKSEILAVQDLVPYMNFEIASVSKVDHEIIGIVGDGYLGRYTVYKPLVQSYKVGNYR